jgi:hypothetical protein
MLPGPRAAPAHGPQPRHQFFRRKGLDQVVVGPAVQAQHAVGQPVARGQQQRRGGRSRRRWCAASAGPSRPAAASPPARRRRARRARPRTRPAGAPSPRQMALGAQEVAQAFAQEVVVFDQQQAHGGEGKPGSARGDTVSPGGAKSSGWLHPAVAQSSHVGFRNQPRPARGWPGSRGPSPAAGRLPVLGLLANRPFVPPRCRGARPAPQTWLFGAGAAGHAGVPALPAAWRRFAWRPH